MTRTSTSGCLLTASDMSLYTEERGGNIHTQHLPKVGQSRAPLGGIQTHDIYMYMYSYQSGTPVIMTPGKWGQLYKQDSLVPRPSRAPARKRVWNLSQNFLALLSQHVRKTGKPIRTQVSKQSCDFNAYWNTTRFQFQLTSVCARIGIGPHTQST